MPPNWIHRCIDILAFGQDYRKVHKDKDEAWKELGTRHRKINHQWYSMHGYEWSLEEPFPDKLISFFEDALKRKGEEFAEEMQVWVSHDYFDKIWDTCSYEERKFIAALLRHWILSPRLLLEKAGVDVYKGRVLRKYNRDNSTGAPMERWEHVSGLKRDCQNLESHIKSKTIDELI